MKTCDSLAALIHARETISPYGWIFVEKNIDKRSVTGALQAQFFIQENDDDEFFGELHLATWMETPIFIQILQSCEKRMTVSTLTQYAEALVHYLVHDDFMD